MYKIVIADDQKHVCDGLEFLIKSYFPDLDLIGIYRDGKELLESFK